MKDRDFLWMLIPLLTVLLLAGITFADEFTDLVKQVEQMSVKKQQYCYCGGKAGNCICDLADCKCGEGACKIQRTKKPKLLHPAPKADFLHDCGCPSASCNCYSGCHCSENRAENRQESRWVKDGGRWYLYRGSRCLGSINSKGSYYRWLSDDYDSEPSALPKPLPTERSMVHSTGVCRT